MGDRSSDESSSKSDGEDRLPAIDLSTFVLSLSTTALYQLGLVPDPSTGKKAEPNLSIARQTIATLEMLRLKTRGNLEPEEVNLFDSLLYELRLRFVEAKDGIAAARTSSGGASGD